MEWIHVFNRRNSDIYNKYSYSGVQPDSHFS